LAKRGRLVFGKRELSKRHKGKADVYYHYTGNYAVAISLKTPTVCSFYLKDPTTGKYREIPREEAKKHKDLVKWVRGLIWG